TMLSNISLQARSLNSGGGQVTVNSPQTLTIGSNADFSAGKALSLTTQTGLITIGADSSFSAGSLTSTAPATGVLTPDQIAQAGSLTVKAAAGMQTLGNVSFETNGANLTITASLTNAPITLGSANNFQANGGNVVVLASGQVSGDAGSSFYTR